MALIDRMKLSAFSNAGMRSFFGTDFDTFRFFDQQLPTGEIAKGTCLRVNASVSEAVNYLHNGENRLTMPRVQFDVLDVDPVRANQATAAVQAWLQTGGANFVDNRWLTSPLSTSGRPSNFRLNTRSALEWRKTPQPVPVTCLDYRIYNVEP